MNPLGSRIAAIFVVVSGLAALGCGGSGRAGAGETGDPVEPYRVERSSDDHVETVRTVSGSLWGAGATLVEEVSIGEEVGDDAYLFGSVRAAWATEDHIYVLDSQVPAVRVYDLAGKHLFNVGTPGQGPGEYGMPTAVAVTDEGRVLVADAMGARINVYDAQGRYLEDWPLASQKSALGLTLAENGTIYTQSWSLEQERLGVQAVSPDGLVGDIVFPPPFEIQQATLAVGEGVEMILPFAPRYTWALAPGGEIVAGTGERYSFEVHRPDGKVMVVERDFEPVQVEGNEAEFRARLASSALRKMTLDNRISRGDIPDHKPAFSDFYPDRSGRLWVARQGPGRKDPDCTDADDLASPRLLMGSFEMRGKPGSWDEGSLAADCWADTFIFDLFDVATGDFLGAVQAPEPGFRIPLFAEGDTVLAAVGDELGTLRLKKYRLVID